MQVEVAYHESTVLLLQVHGRAGWVEDIGLQDLSPAATEEFHALPQVVLLLLGVGHSRAPRADGTTRRRRH